MPAYRYRAVRAAGGIAKGRLVAANESELAQHLNAAGLELIAARAKNETLAPRARFYPRLEIRSEPRALAGFCLQMSDLLAAGISFAAALSDLESAAASPALREALADVAREVRHGSMISAAFARHPRLFPDIFVAILAAGEKSGDLEKTFAHLARYAETRARTAEQLRRALRYPLFLFAVAIGVVVFMMIMVVPEVIQFLKTFHNRLPLATRVLIAVSQIVVEGWWIAGLAIAGMIAALAIARKHSQAVACTLDSALLRLPLLGPALRKLALARFTHSFAILFQSGLGVPASLRAAKAALGNKALEAALGDAERQVQAGRALSAAMENLFPPFAARLLRTGEQSGRLGKALGHIASAYDREVTDVTERLIGAIEPALTLMIGLILVWVVLAVLGPIYGNLARITASGGY
ncbi:MAG TPA: type II secretion system F family protein [Alphaproteobacteria bacterium]|nr:type II secretion system F family protein [Alphaproteobacteria bacterium]